MGDRKSRAGRPHMIAATLKLGDATSQMLIACAKKNKWKKFDAITATVVRVSLRLDDKAPLPTGIDETDEAIIRNEIEKMRSYASIFPENSPEIDGKSNGNSPEIDGKSGNNSGQDARATEELRIGEKSPSPLPANLQAEEEAFEDLWAVYPRKQAKNDARRAFHRVIVEDGVAPATIFYAVMEQAKSAAWKEDGGKFVPSLAKWLDGGRWNDVLSAPAEKNLAAPPAQDPFTCPTPLPPEERWKKPKPEEIREESKT